MAEDGKSNKVHRVIVVKSLPEAITRSTIIEFFNTFGKMVNYKFGYKLVKIEFEDVNTVDKLLREDVFFQARKLKIQSQEKWLNEDTERKRPKCHVVKERREIAYERLHTIFNKPLTFDEQLYQFLNAIQLTDDEIKQRYDPICSYLESIFATTFEDCKMYKFGSTQTGLALKGSDLDVFMDVGTNKTWGIEKISRHAKNILFQRNGIFSNIVVILGAKTPIIKFSYLPTNVLCDLSFTSGFGVWNSYLIQFCLSRDVRVKPLMMFIKYWGGHLKICRSGQITNYAMAVLIIFFLQQPSVNIIPPLTELRKKCKPVFINGWQINFDMNPELPAITNNKSIPQLLEEFFTFYAKFMFATKVICPLNGVAIPRIILYKSRNSLPAPLLKYTAYDSMKEPHKLRFGKSMCVQDPIELHRNLTFTVPLRTLDCFQTNCQIAAKTCRKTQTNNHRDLLETLFCVTVEPKNPIQDMIVLEPPPHLIGGLREICNVRTDAPHELEIVQKYWHSFVFDIIKEFLEKVMSMQVEVLFGDNEAKRQKIKKLSNVHTKDYNKLILVCTATKCTWNLDRSKLHVKLLDPSLCALNKETHMSKLIVGNTNPAVKKMLVPLKMECQLFRKEDQFQTVLQYRNVCGSKKVNKECRKFMRKLIPEILDATLNEKKHSS